MNEKLDNFWWFNEFIFKSYNEAFSDAIDIMDVNDSVDLILNKQKSFNKETLSANVNLTIKTPIILFLFILNMLTETWERLLNKRVHEAFNWKLDLSNYYKI